MTSAEERAKISARMRERWKDPKTRLLYLRTTGSSVAAAKRRAALKASGAEDELARKRSENQKRRWADPATRARLETAMKRPETRQRMRAAAGVRNASARTMKLYARPDGEIVALRSSWEADFAEFADRLGIRWTYEEHRFVLSDGHSITPDFRVSAPGFGDFHVELHRILNVKPGDERKVERLKRAVGEVSEYRLLNERDVVSMQAALRRLRRDAQRGD